MSQPKLKESLGVAGSGTIALGLARIAAPLGEVVLWARSEDSARRVGAAVGDGVRVVTELDELTSCTYVIESVVEDLAVKQRLLAQLSTELNSQAVLASTTSSFSIEQLAAATSRPDLFAGIHLFNPVEKMQLVELAFPKAATEETRQRSHELCGMLGKVPVEVPDSPGFVVNRLLFPYLMSAVRLLEEHDLDPRTVDECMRLGAAHPMGPLALLDLVGLDVSASIAESVGVEVPDRVRELIAAGALGRKTGSGFYSY